MVVTWSKRASKSYLKTLESILEKWTVKEGEAFMDEVDSYINNLSKNKMLCPPSKKINLRKCVVSKQTSLIYKVYGKKISIVVFIDNKSNHKY